MIFGYYILDRFGWPIERIYYKSKFRTFIGWIKFLIRCCIHGRKITKNWQHKVEIDPLACCEKREGV